jgi:hypothetical protein
VATAEEQADQAAGRANTLQEAPAVPTTPQSATPSQRESQSADSKPAAETLTLVYKPPLGRGAPTGLVAGGSRGTNTCLAGDFKDGNTTLTLSVLAPADHVGLTAQEQPSLYWYLSAATSCRVEVTLTNEQAVEPLLDFSLSPPTNPGVQRVRLADHGARLTPGVQYQWAVALVPDPDHRSKDIVALGAIKRIEATEALHTKLAQANKGDVAAIYAEAGLWYDAVAAVSDLIATAPQDSVLRTQRAALLEQVRLSEVAERDRGRDRR